MLFPANPYKMLNLGRSLSRCKTWYASLFQGSMREPYRGALCIARKKLHRVQTWILLHRVIVEPYGFCRLPMGSFGVFEYCPRSKTPYGLTIIHVSIITPWGYTQGTTVRDFLDMPRFCIIFDMIWSWRFNFNLSIYNFDSKYVLVLPTVKNIISKKWSKKNRKLFLIEFRLKIKTHTKPWRMKRSQNQNLYSKKVC